METFATLRDASLRARLSALTTLGLYRQSVPATLSLWLSAILRKL